MFFLISKLLTFFFYPLSWVFILLVVSFFWKQRARFLRITALVLLWFFSNAFIQHEVNHWWETPILLDTDIPKAETAVVLGGYAYYSPSNDRLTFRESGDRLFQAIRLIEMGSADQLVISGGSGFVFLPDMKEALFVEDYLNDIHFPKRKLHIESESRNTHENAVFTAEILKEKSLDNSPVILVTSAYHMPRAIACFEKQGIEVIPFATDPRIGDRMFSLDHMLLPSANTLAYWNVLIHEWVGYVGYWIMGYI